VLVQGDLKHEEKAPNVGCKTSETLIAASALWSNMMCECYDAGAVVALRVAVAVLPFLDLIGSLEWCADRLTLCPAPLVILRSTARKETYAHSEQSWPGRNCSS
jgi:hypothetical protein